MESATHDRSPDTLAAVPAAQAPPAAGPLGRAGRLGRWAVAWFRSLTIERRILAGFTLVFTGILVISVVSYRNTTVLLSNSGQDQRSHELLQLLGTIDGAMDEAEQSHRRYLVTGEAAYLRAYRSMVEEKPTFVRYLQDLTKDSPEQQERVATLERLMQRQVNAEADAISRRDEGGFEAVRKLALEGAAKRELAAIHRLIADMEAHEREALRRRVGQSAAWTRSTIGLLGIGALLQLVLLAAVYYLIRHDITERRRVAAELQRRGELLAAANKELEAFSYSVSHDLRAPLRHIDGYASLLRKAVGGSLNEKAARYLQTISDSAKQMGQLIDDLLVFSRMGRQEMLHTTVNLDQLVKTILYDLRLDLQGREISWTIETLPEVPGDAAMLRQVFVNLITNALKFTGTRPLARIDIGVDRRTPSEVVLYVRDNGVGFDMQYATKLFGVFQRLHRADEFEGTGIGLANVRRIVHRHGGRTWAEGAPDKGATFYVALPTRRPQS
jgi:signal transduction histidine kinase